jgi:hypothetical protein
MLEAEAAAQTHLEVQAVEELALHLHLALMVQLTQVAVVEQQILVQHQEMVVQV